MPELTPLDDNRQEHFLNGEDLEPITRREHFYAGRESELPAGHQEPETREEWFIQKYRGGGGDVTVVPLSVTENGTYSEEGKAYSPVNVNVPLPTNAYLLKSVPNLPQAIASFNDGEDMPMPSLKVAIEPQQEGSGDPSPTNVRPISGWDEADVSVSGVNVWDEEWELGIIDVNTGATGLGNRIVSKNLIAVKEGETYYFSRYIAFVFYYDANGTYISYGQPNATTRLMTIPSNCAYIKFYTVSTYTDTYNNDISINYPSTDTEYHAYNGQTYTISFVDSQGQSVEVFGGSVDVVNGGENPSILRKIDLGSLTWTYDARFSGFRASVTTYKKYAGGEIPNGYCEIYKMVTLNNFLSNNPNNSISFGIVGGYDNNILIRDTNYTDATQFKTAVTGKYLCYELATPTTFHTQPTAIKSLRGVNNVYANTGDITDAEYFSKEV